MWKNGIKAKQFSSWRQFRTESSQGQKTIRKLCKISMDILRIFQNDDIIAKKGL